MGHAYLSPEYVRGVVFLKFRLEAIVFPLLLPPIAYADLRQGFSYLAAKKRAEQSVETVADNTDVCGSAADSMPDISTNGKTCDIAPDDGTSSDIRDVAPPVEQHPGNPDSDDKDE